MALAEIGEPPVTAPSGNAAGNRVVVSAAAELVWGGIVVARADDVPPQHLSVDALRGRRLPSRIREFWNDGLVCLPEVLVLAARGALLDDDGLDEFLDDLPRLCRMETEVVMLTTEDAQDRARIVARLDSLRTDSRTRAAYGRLLQSIWEVMEPVWRRQGRADARRTAAAWQALAQRGAKLPDAAALNPALCAADIVDMAETAASARRLLVAPTYFGTGYLIVDTGPVTLLSSAGERARDVRNTVRVAARAAAARYKALSDPTRMAILSMVQASPLSVGEVARRLELAQPTVSAHFAALRAAGLVREHQEGRTVRYSLDAARVDGILAEVRSLVLNQHG